MAQYFSGKAFVFELGDELGFLPWKDRLALCKRIQVHGGKVASVVDGDVSFVVSRDVSASEFADSLHLHHALRLGIPIVSTRYLDACEASGKCVKYDAKAHGVALPAEAVAALRAGFAQYGSAGGGSTNKEASKFASTAKHIHWIEPYDEPQAAAESTSCAPKYPLEYDVVRQHFFAPHTMLELHATHDKRHSGPRLRLMVTSAGGSPSCKAAFFADAAEAEAAYSSVFASSSGTVSYRATSATVGSVVSRRMASLPVASGSLSAVPTELRELVKSLFDDAWRQLEASTGVKMYSGDDAARVLESVSLMGLSKAEAALLDISHILLRATRNEQQGSAGGAPALGSADGKLLEERSKAFFSVVPASAALEAAYKDPTSGSIAVRSLEVLELLEDVVRALKAILTQGEAAVGNVFKAPPEVQYASLGCEVCAVPAGSEKYASVKQRLLGSLCGGVTANVVNIWSLRREREWCAYRKSVGNEQLLFHASRAGNWTSILGQGLRVPFAARLRRDRGMLGRGIYFGDSLTTALRYTTNGSRSTAYVLVCSVSLGEMFHTTTHRYDLEQPPAGFDSVHGVRSTGGTTDFADDEYVIYDATQQHMSYLVELKVCNGPAVEPSAGLQAVTKLLSKSSSRVSTDPRYESKRLGEAPAVAEAAELTADPKVKTPAVGLLGGGDEPVPLMNTRLCAKVIDLIGEVVVLQQYRNASSQTIEAKYVFPLQSGCAVCGFEAYINDKKVVGRVKEKEVARKEYKAAVEAGHGAYLMDESVESPDVFTVSVGNLPPKCDVVIRITYVLELRVNTGRRAIEFVIPSSIHPQVREAAMREETQATTSTVASYVGDGRVGLEIGLDMPFDITGMECSHPVLVKRTACRATLKSTDLDMSRDFALLVRLSVMNTPRIWVEEHPSRRSKAAMITMFPEIEVGGRKGSPPKEVLVLLDCSASMQESDAHEDARTAAMLLLRGLRPEWRFNVVAFGSLAYYLFPQSVAATFENVEKAVKFVQREAGPLMGGTDPLRVLESVHSLLSLSPGRSADVFLFSDGVVDNEPVIGRSVRECTTLRVFCLGCGSSAAVAILRAIARVGRGQAELLSHAQKSKWRYSIEKQLQRASQPALTEIDVEWSTEQSVRLRQQVNATVTQTPRHVMSLFEGESTIVYGMVRHGARQCEIVARRCGPDVSRDQYGYWPEQRFLVTVHGLSFLTGDLIHRLCVRARIREWTEGVIEVGSNAENEAKKAATKQLIIDLGCEFGLVTPFTSMIAVEERSDAEKKAQSGAACTTPVIDDIASRDVVDMITEVLYEEGGPHLLSLPTEPTKEEAPRREPLLVVAAESAEPAAASASSSESSESESESDGNKSGTASGEGECERSGSMDSEEAANVAEGIICDDDDAPRRERRSSAPNVGGWAPQPQNTQLQQRIPTSFEKRGRGSAPMRCFNCGRYGHSGRDCTFVSAGGAVMEDDSKLELAAGQAQRGGPYIPYSSRGRGRGRGGVVPSQPSGYVTRGPSAKPATTFTGPPREGFMFTGLAAQPQMAMPAGRQMPSLQPGQTTQMQLAAASAMPPPMPSGAASFGVMRHTAATTTASAFGSAPLQPPTGGMPVFASSASSSQLPFGAPTSQPPMQSMPSLPQRAAHPMGGFGSSVPQRPAAAASTSSFGVPAPQPPTGGMSVFASSASSSQLPFGAPTSQPPMQSMPSGASMPSFLPGPPGASLFGSSVAAPTPQLPAGGFGAPLFQAGPPAASSFGSSMPRPAAAASTSSFGFGTPAPQPPTGGMSVFASSASSSQLPFGAPTSQPPMQSMPSGASMPSFLPGPPGASLFGSSVAAPTPQLPAGGFGAPLFQAGPPAASSFGSSMPRPAAAASTSSFGFGTPAPQPPTGGVSGFASSASSSPFGAPTSQPPSFGFGAPAPQPWAGGMSGFTSSASSSQPPFGAPTSQPPMQSMPSFGAPVSSFLPGPPGASLFGSSVAAPTPQLPAGGFGAPLFQPGLPVLPPPMPGGACSFGDAASPSDNNCTLIRYFSRHNRLPQGVHLRLERRCHNHCLRRPCLLFSKRCSRRWTHSHSHRQLCLRRNRLLEHRHNHGSHVRSVSADESLPAGSIVIASASNAGVSASVPIDACPSGCVPRNALSAAVCTRAPAQQLRPQTGWPHFVILVPTRPLPLHRST